MRLPAAWHRLPRLVRFLLQHGLAGFAVSAVFMGALLGSNPGGAGDLLLGAAGHWWPAVLLWFFVGLTFGGVQIAAATMLLDEPEDGPRRGSAAPVTHGLVPIRVRARRR